MNEVPSLPHFVEEVRALGEPYIRGVGSAMAEVVAAFKGAAEQLIAAEPEETALPEEDT